VSATRQRHSRLTSSTRARIRKRRPSLVASLAKSRDQRWFKACGIASGALVPSARLRPPRRRTCSHSSPWRLVDLAQWVWEEFRIAISAQTVSRELRAMGYRKLSARPRHHAQAEGAIEAFKNTSLPHWRRSRAPRASSRPE
jgi:hypothetical protein